MTQEELGVVIEEHMKRTVALILSSAYIDVIDAARKYYLDGSHSTEERNAVKSFVDQFTVKATVG